MPLTKQQIKTILLEEVDAFAREGNDKTGKKTVELLEKLLGSLKDLDLSIDYLTAGLTDDTPMGIGLSQSTLGRLAKAQKAPVPVSAPAPVRQERD